MQQKEIPAGHALADPDDPPRSKENNEVVVGAAVPRRIADAIKRDAQEQKRTKSYVIRGILLRAYDEAATNAA